MRHNWCVALKLEAWHGATSLQATLEIFSPISRLIFTKMDLGIFYWMHLSSVCFIRSVERYCVI